MLNVNKNYITSLMRDKYAFPDGATDAGKLFLTTVCSCLICLFLPAVRELMLTEIFG